MKYNKVLLNYLIFNHSLVYFTVATQTMTMLKKRKENTVTLMTKRIGIDTYYFEGKNFYVIAIIYVLLVSSTTYLFPFNV